MKALTRQFWFLLLLMLLAAPARAQVALPPPLPGQVAWTPVPGVQGVMYAPNLGQDFFQYNRGYYCFQKGSWYHTGSPQGPWVQTTNIPQPFYQIQAPYFKTPPGWAKGKKTGWGGAPMPPGQMKKMYK
jgi:hypothetical protein